MNSNKDSNYDEENTNQTQTIIQLENQNNELIDDLVNVAGNMKGIAVTLGNDIAEQNKILDDTKRKVEEVDKHVQKSNEKVKKVNFNSKDKRNFGIITMLTFVLIGVIILAIIF